MGTPERAAGERYGATGQRWIAWAAATAVLVLAVALLGYLLLDRSALLAEVREENRLLRAALDAVETPATEPRPAAAEPTIGLTDYHRRHLMRRGLSDPEREIVEDLRQRPELIPYPGVLGGTMFFPEQHIHILTDRWVFATFEDGHILGHMLLQYDVADRGQIRWRVIESYLE